MSLYRIGLLVFAGLVTLSFSAQSQERQLGTWKSFMPYGNSRGISDAGSKVFSASYKSLFSIDKNTGEIRPYDKATGLSDIDIKTINYDPSTKVLAVAYNNSNLDLIYDEIEVYNLADFKLKNTSGSVNLNGLSFFNGNCYVSSDAGISVIDLAKREIKNTYVLGSGGQPAKVYATTIGGNFIYAATEEGVKYAPVNSPNLQDFILRSNRHSGQKGFVYKCP